MSLHGCPLFINALSRELNNKIAGKILTDCFSTGADELFLVFENFAIKTTFLKGEAVLSFPDAETLPRKNRQSQFRQAIGQKVRAVDTIYMERAFRIRTSHSFIFFKFFGARANVLFGQKDQTLAIFRRNLQTDLTSGVAMLQSRDIRLADVELFEKADFEVRYPFLRGDIINGLFETGDFDEHFRRLEEIKNEMKNPEWQIVSDLSSGITLKVLLKNEEVVHTTFSAMEAQHTFARKYLSESRFREEKSIAVHTLEKQLHRSREKLAALSRELESRGVESKYKIYADVLMANLWQLKEGMTEARLPDFDGTAQLVIPLKKDQSPQKNAERYYRKAKNEHLERERLAVSIAVETERVKRLSEELEQAVNAGSVKDLPDMAGATKTEESSQLPYRTMEFGEYQIWLGRNAQSNEAILKRAGKLDIWLHARDVSGSHVLVRNPGKNKVPARVIEAAASLAAGHSKRKSEGLVAVIFTERRYVRKFKGAKPGQVKVDREEVILVPPMQQI